MLVGAGAIGAGDRGPGSRRAARAARWSRACPARPPSPIVIRWSPAASACWARARPRTRWRVRHPVHGRDELPVHEAPPRAGQGARRADRRRPGPGRQSPPHRGGVGRRRGRDAPGADPDAARAATDRGFLEKAQKDMEAWRSDMEALEDSERDSHPAAVPDARHRPPRRRRRDPLLRLGDDRDVGGAPLRHPRRPEVHAQRKPREHGARRSVRDRVAGRVPRSPMHRVRRRRRVRHVDGRSS